jgi:hypothetical protein
LGRSIVGQGLFAQNFRKKVLAFYNRRYYIYNNDILSQPLCDYPRLKRVSAEQKSRWRLSNIGIHWEEIDEDISFESFSYDPGDPLVVKMRDL